jgi:hypothetical protein
MPECKERVEVGKYIVKYCTLPIGHKGKHKAEYTIINMKEEVKINRCLSTNEKGLQCGLPNKHIGNHSMAGNITKSWT